MMKRFSKMDAICRAHGIERQVLPGDKKAGKLDLEFYSTLLIPVEAWYPYKQCCVVQRTDI